MKRLLIAALLALSSSVFAATLNPVQLLNPAGSAAGQAIVSTGTSSPPAWGAVSATALAPVAANTVIANFTGSSGAPVAFAMPTCSSSGKALQYSGSGIVCTSNYALTTGTLAQFSATTSAQLAGIVSDETGSGPLVFGTSPTITTPNIAGVTNGSNGAAGMLGESPTPTNLSGVSLTTGVGANCSSVSLTAGNWLVSGVIVYTAASTTVLTQDFAGVSTTSATLGATGTYAKAAGFSLSNNNMVLPAPLVPVNITSTTTVYLVGSATFTTSTATCGGFMYAIRIH